MDGEEDVQNVLHHSMEDSINSKKLQEAKLAEEDSSQQVDYIPSKAKDFALHVIDLSYIAERSIFYKLWDQIQLKIIEYKLKWIIPSLKIDKNKINRDLPLHRIHFSAKAGELVTLLGNAHERMEVIKLISGRKKHGIYGGDIRLSGPGLSEKTYYYDNMAYVYKTPLFIPGLTFLEMLHFSAQLKIKPKPGINTSDIISTRVTQMLTLMELTPFQDVKLTPFPDRRGEEGAHLRRLSIACEIVDMPPLIIIDEPTGDFDPALSVQILKCLKKIAKLGHIVITSITKPFAQELDLVDRVVLFSEGYTIYSGHVKQAEEFFSSPNLGYKLGVNADLADFLLDIASGVERPAEQRVADAPQIMQLKYEESDYYSPIQIENPAETTTAFSKEFFAFYGMARFDKPLYALYRLYTVVKRSLYTTGKDEDTMALTFLAPLLLGLILGYLMTNSGQYGDYCTNLIGLPYAKTTNLISLFFFTSSFCWALPFANLPVILRRLELFRYEQEAGCCTIFAFLLGTIVSEGIFSTLRTWIFASVIYGFVNLGEDDQDYAFFISTLVMMGLIGVAGAYLFSALFRNEMVITDLSLLIMVLATLLSGFTFTFASIKDYFNDASVVNPIRWSFEGMMKWKFSKYKDGSVILDVFSFDNFNYHNTKYILNRFLWITVSVLIFALAKEPNFLRRRKEEDNKRFRDSTASRDSRDSSTALPHLSSELGVVNVPRKTTRASETIRPTIFMKEASVTGNATRLSVSSSIGGKQSAHEQHRGDTVAFSNLSLDFQDRASPGGYKSVLNKVSGKFEWGEMSLILGAPGSGKSSLLHLLAGDVPLRARINGKVYYDGKAQDLQNSLSVHEHLWQRCALVPARNEQLMDLTVKEVLVYAMMLRCVNSEGFALIEDNVKVTAENLHLTEMLDRKVRKLNSGEFKRLSIAEEMVHGPKLLFMDEPTTGVSIFEQAIMMATFREMVNQDRTVVATIHQCAPEVFKLFDTLLLLSQGRVIYHGSTAGAAQFFTMSPFQYNDSLYSNPADFLVDISGRFITDSKGGYLESEQLEQYFRTTENSKDIQASIRDLEASQQSDGSASTQPAVPRMPSTLPPGVTASEVENPVYISYEKPGKSEITSVVTDETAAGQRVRPPGEIQTSTLPLPLLGLQLCWQEVQLLAHGRAWTDAFFRGKIIFQRSVRLLLNRPQLQLSSAVLHAFLALLFGWIMGDSDGEKQINNMISYFALFAMFQILLNIPFIYYTYNCHGVFLKEHSRGLYPNWLKWIATDYPVLLLRFVDAIVFLGISWPLIDQDTSTDIYGFAFLTNMVYILAAHLMSEAFMYLAQTKESCYIGIVASAFANSLLSGLLIKASTLPKWIAPWGTSLSIIRWSMQTHYINLYEDQDYFSKLPYDYDVYTALLNLYGWGGKTKGYCLGMIAIAVVIYKLLGLWTGAMSAMSMKGGQSKRQTR